MKSHRLADLFPMMSETEFEELKKDIKANGLREPIWVFEDQILDGRNRYKACKLLRIEPKIRNYTKQQGDPLKFVISMNLARRHLNESQRAMVAARLATLKTGQRSDRVQGVPIGTAAKMMNVSERSAKRAAVVRDYAEPEIQRAVDEGKLAVSVAADAAKLPKAQQHRAAKLAADGQAVNAVQIAIAEAKRAEKVAVRRAKIANKSFALPPTVQVIEGDCRGVLATMPAESVDCVVTSPPYFNMRDYQAAGQIGLETTLAEYVGNLVEVFRAVRRVLKPDGTVWIVIGDSYCGSGKGSGIPSVRNGGGLVSISERTAPRMVPDGIKPKNLMLVPFEVAKALRDDGWWLRSDIIWDKPNITPESVTDRCTRNHEQIWMLAKSESYHFDAEAIKEPSNYPDDERKSRSRPYHKSAPTALIRGSRPGAATYPMRNKRSVWHVATTPSHDDHCATYPEALIEPTILAGCPPGGTVLDPFAGTGTTGTVAERLGRGAVLIELNPQYCEMIRARLGKLEAAE